MKRVLNSGTIKLPYIKGAEADLVLRYNNNWDSNMLCTRLFEDCQEGLGMISFTFEIKAPLLTFLTFQDSNLGTLNRLPELDHPVAYVPAQFYTNTASEFNNMESKQCNIYSTKLFNFYSAALNFRNNLLKEGLCKEQADLVLPQGMFINFIWKISLGDLIKFIEEHYSDSPETYGYCSTFALYMQEHTPMITRWVKANRWQNISL